MMGFFSSLFGTDEKTKLIRAAADRDRDFIAKYNGEKIWEWFDDSIIVDYNSNEILIKAFEVMQQEDLNKPILYKIVKFDDLIDVSIEINNQVITESNGGITRALIGGALFGIGGAIVGASTAQQTNKKIIKDGHINLIIDDLITPIISIRFIPQIGQYEYDMTITKKYINDAAICVERLRAIIRKFRR